MTWTTQGGYLPVWQGAIDDLELQTYFTDTRAGRWLQVATLRGVEVEGEITNAGRTPGPASSSYRRQEELMKLQMLATGLGATLLSLVLVACGDDAASGDDDGVPDGPDPSETVALAGDPAPELDPVSRRAATPAGEVDAVRAEGETYVGPVDDDLFIGVAVGEPLDDGDTHEALVYVCDGRNAEYLTGDIGPATTTMEGRSMRVELALGDGEVSGAVVRDGEPRSFTAGEASGEAGLYSASFEHDDVDYRPMWIALEDGTQKGGACWQCCSGRECHICCPAAADTAGPTVDWTELQYWWRRLRD